MGCSGCGEDMEVDRASSAASAAEGETVADAQPLSLLLDRSTHRRTAMDGGTGQGQ